MSTTDSHKLTYPEFVKAKGFTLLELMVVLVIVIILSRIAVPQFNSLIESQKSIGFVNNLLADMDYARSEAVKEGQNVTLCATANGTTCSTSTDWSIGWMVFTTSSTGTNLVLRNQAAFPANFGTFTTTPATSSIVYNRDGFALNLTSGELFTLTTSDSNLGATRCVWLDTLGRQVIQTASTAKTTGQGTAC